MAHGPEKDYSNFRVLVVDDRQAMRKIVRTLLNGMGFRQIEEAQEGGEALSRIRAAAAAQTPSGSQSKGFDLIIADWVMPGMDGLTLLGEVRGDIDHFHMPFLMLTSENDIESVTRATKLGVTDYIIKPFEARILEQKIRKILATS